VSLNGKPLGVLWKAPYTIDVTGIMQPGKNTLEVRVTNQWNNRIAGDLNLPEGSKILSGTGSSRSATARMDKSGLLGPVFVISEVQ